MERDNPKFLSRLRIVFNFLINNFWLCSIEMKEISEVI